MTRTATKAQEQAERENTCFAILDNLANVSNATDDFLKQTFEPSIGEAEDGDANTRIVNTNTMKAAAERFADLVDAAIDENTTSYSWSDDMIGTMTYNKSTDGKSYTPPAEDYLPLARTVRRQQRVQGYSLLPLRRCGEQA